MEFYVIVSQFLKGILVCSLSLVLLACGGGGSSDEVTTASVSSKVASSSLQTYTATIIDGYLRGAVVTLDLNDNGLKDNNEPSVISGRHGVAIFSLSSDIDPANYSIIVDAVKGVTFDESLNNFVSHNFSLSAPKGDSVVSPLTSLVYLQIHSGLNKEQALLNVSQLIDVEKDTLLVDFIASNDANLLDIASSLVRLNIFSGDVNQLRKNSQNLFDDTMVYAGLKSDVSVDTLVVRQDDDQLIIAPNNDFDNDGVLNVLDVFPTNSLEVSDLDGDGIGDNSDVDRDGDGILNLIDAFPTNNLESKDLDGDGIGDNSDTDRDGDNVLNSDDIFPDNTLESADLDGDGIGDNSDVDRDGDGILNFIDAFPVNNLESKDLDGDGIGDNSDTDRDGDNVLNNDDMFPDNALENADLDGDGIGDNTDADRDGDGILNTSDFSLALDETIESTINAGEWHYFELQTPAQLQLAIELANLIADVDVYVKKSVIPTLFDYDCRSNESGISMESCLMRLEDEATYYIGVHALVDSAYSLTASVKEIEKKKAVILLHGLASSPTTWNSLISDDSFFDGQCEIIEFDEALSELPIENADGLSCFNLKFGGYDRAEGYYSTGLDDKKCARVGGCSGDYTNFQLLGSEVESAVAKVVNKLGIDTEIVLLGHSRGGLAARAYLQNTLATNKEYIKGLVTTGTPHQGSPFGRFYQYMDENCTPKIAYRQDNGRCEDNWETIEMLLGTRTFLGFNYHPDYAMDLLAPSIDFLSPSSPDITSLNDNLFSLENLVIGQLSYAGTEFGQLASNYDLYDYGVWFSGDHPHSSSLRYVEDGATRASLIGDGIVPVNSQKLSLLLALDAREVDVELASPARVLHTDETGRVSDLAAIFEKMYKKIGWTE